MKQIAAVISYSHDDTQLLEKLHKHLAPLRREGLLKAWTDREILSGIIDEQIDRRWEEAELYLFLISSSFIDSNYCYEREFKGALEKFRLGRAVIVPIILRDCHWKIPELSQFKAYPTDGKAIVGRHWHNEDEAFADVVHHLRGLIEKFPDLPQRKLSRKQSAEAKFKPDERHVTAEQRKGLRRICDEVIQRLTIHASTGPEQALRAKKAKHYGIVWNQFNDHFGIGQLAELPKERYEEAKSWLLQYRASKDTRLKRANPHQYRNTLLKTIHGLARELKWSKDDLHAFAADKIGYAAPVESLGDLGLNQLERVRDRVRYEQSKRRARAGQRRAPRKRAEFSDLAVAAGATLPSPATHPAFRVTVLDTGVDGQQFVVHLLFQNDGEGDRLVLSIRAIYWAPDRVWKNGYMFLGDDAGSMRLGNINNGFVLGSGYKQTVIHRIEVPGTLLKTADAEFGLHVITGRAGSGEPQDVHFPLLKVIPAPQSAAGVNYSIYTAVNVSLDEG